MITSTANAKVKQIANYMRSAKDRKKDKVFLVEGRKMFLEAPKEWMQEVYITSENEELIQEREKMDKVPCKYECVSEEVFKKMSDTQTPQGVLTVLKRPEYELSELCKGKTPFLMVLENLQDPGNMGTIFRTAEGAGVTGILLSKDCVDLFNPKTIRATMGSIYRMPFVVAEDLQESIRFLKGQGVKCYAAHLKGEKYHTQFDFTLPTAFFIGNEGNGLTKETADLADTYLRIPMEGKLESLNAAVASAILMYETHRQRQ